MRGINMGNKKEYKKPVLNIQGNIEELTKGAANQPYSDTTGRTMMFQ